MPELIPPLAHLGTPRQEPVHRALRAEIRALVEQGGVDLGGGQGHEAGLVPPPLPPPPPPPPRASSLVGRITPPPAAATPRPCPASCTRRPPARSSACIPP